jgi:hypothetical protein
VSKLGPKWTYAYVNGSYTGFVARHPVVPEDTYKVYSGTGATIMIDSKTPVHVYSMHLDWNNYGPYAANNKLATKESQLDAGEYNSKFFSAI